MVCKDEVLAWFKDLDSYKRIDVICELLSMCVPFEIRFVGNIVEEHGKQTYQQLRAQELFANDLDKLDKDLIFKTQSINEESVRHRVLLNLSLLSSRNYSAANWYCKKFLRTDFIEDLIVKEKDDIVQNELLLLFTMAARHPAFTFEQKEFFSRILIQLNSLRESRHSRPSTYGYPPGFGYPSGPRKQYGIPDSSVPVGFSMQPPGFPQIDFVAVKNWPGITCGAPEVPPFPQALQPPQPNVSPLVSQSGSPSQSRSTSPHRSSMIRPLPPNAILPPPPGTPMNPALTPQSGVQMPPSGGAIPPSGGPLPPQAMEMMALVPMSTPPPAMGMPLPPMEPLSHSSQPSSVFVKPNEEELNSTVKEELIKPQHVPWPQSNAATEMKPMNGMRLQFTTSKIRPTCLAEQMQNVNLADIECPAYQSNSSSNSSPNQTPPGTPLSTCPPPPLAVPPHGPGRGGPLEKSRPNGMGGVPGGFCPPPPPPLCDTTSPPPAAFTNCTVPYSYQSFATLQPNRSMFHYNSFHRPTFAAQYPPSFATDTNTFPTTYSHLPYFSVMYSSYPPPAAAQQQPPRTHPPGCYNCGAPSHLGSECTQQNVDEITEKKTYQLDYSQPQDGGDKL